MPGVRRGVDQRREGFDRRRVVDRLEQITNPQTKEVLTEALHEIDRLCGARSRRAGRQRQLVQRELAVEQAELRRVQFMDGGGALLPKDARVGDLIPLPDGRVYLLVDPKGAILVKDGGDR